MQRTRAALHRLPEKPGATCRTRSGGVHCLRLFYAGLLNNRPPSGARLAAEQTVVGKALRFVRPSRPRCRSAGLARAPDRRRGACAAARRLAADQRAPGRAETRRDLVRCLAERGDDDPQEHLEGTQQQQQSGATRKATLGARPPSGTRAPAAPRMVEALPEQGGPRSRVYTATFRVRRRGVGGSGDVARRHRVEAQDGAQRGAQDDIAAGRGAGSGAGGAGARAPARGQLRGARTRGGSVRGGADLCYAECIRRELEGAVYSASG